MSEARGWKTDTPAAHVVRSVSFAPAYAFANSPGL